MVLRHLDLFSGIGGFSLGLEATGGFETVAFCDIEEFPRKVLQKHWPHVKQYTDIKELNYEKLKSDGLLPIDIITGGYPCQPFSVAGRKKGEKDPRHLWPEYFRLVKELRPTWVIGENVGGHIKLGLDTVLENLESEGYAVRTFSIPASAIGANHKRERVWIVAYSERNGLASSEERRSIEETISRKSKGKNNTLNTEGTSSISETKSDVEDTRRSLRQGSEFRGENEKETGQGNADLTQRSSETSEFDVADTTIIGGNEREYRYSEKESEKERILGSKARGESGNVADTKSEGLEGRGVNSTVTGENSNSGDSGPVSSDVADTKGSPGNVNEINGEHGETETQEILGDGSSLSRTQGQVVADTKSYRSFNEQERDFGSVGRKSREEERGERNQSSVRPSSRSSEVADTVSERGRGGETWGQDAENAGQPSTSPWDGWWDFEPDVGRVAHGVSARTHRLKGLGNSLVPAIPFHIGNVILKVMKDG
jgi:DNA-cytosine methyltransferase